MPTIEDLFAAIAAGDAARVDGVLHADPSLAAAERDGVSTLRAAAYAGQTELAQRLLGIGAPVDALDAAALGLADHLRSLLDDDPDRVQQVSGDGFTALHLAAWFGHDNVAELLLARGADPEQPATNGTQLRPLHSAAAGGHCVIAHLLLDRGADIEAAQLGGIRPIHSAAHRNDLVMLQLLLERGADPSVATDDGRMARDLATEPGLLALLPSA